MIDALISTAINWFTVLVSLFPGADVELVSYINDFMSSFRGAMAVAGIFFPVPLLMTLMGIVLIIETAIFSFKVWKWIVANVSFGFLSG